VQPPGVTSWVSNVPISEARFPAPHSAYRYTRLHAAVRSQEDTYRNGTGRYVSVLANIQGTSTCCEIHWGHVLTLAHRHGRGT
jgi:hypothetical protein